MEYIQEKSAAQIPGGKTASIENKNWSVRESSHDRIDSMAHPWHYIDVYSCLYDMCEDFPIHTMIPVLSMVHESWMSFYVGLANTEPTQKFTKYEEKEFYRS